jgi:maleamate amidohydrolase
MLTLKEQAHRSAIVSELALATGELVVRKTVPSAFFGTPLAQWLTQRGVQTLVVAGAVTSDCVGDRAIAPHDASLFDMGQKYAAVMKRGEALQCCGG